MGDIILNLGAGKQAPLDLSMPYFLVNIDKGYYERHKADVVNTYAERWDLSHTEIYNISENAFTFLERISFQANHIVAYRFLEHVSEKDVLYFIYIMASALEINGTIDIIVPDYTALAKMILDEDVNSKDFQSKNIVLTYELLNDPSCPHASIWTVDRLKYYFELEGRFKSISIEEGFEFDGRDIYLRYKAKRIK